MIAAVKSDDTKQIKINKCFREGNSQRNPRAKSCLVAELIAGNTLATLHAVSAVWKLLTCLFGSPLTSRDSKGNNHQRIQIKRIKVNQNEQGYHR